MILRKYRIKGGSMSPFINENDIVLSSCIPYLFSSPAIGDVVIVLDPRNNNELVKRITDIRDNTFYIRGDNASKSTDSRHFGSVARKKILAKVIYIHHQ